MATLASLRRGIILSVLAPLLATLCGCGGSSGGSDENSGATNFRILNLTQTQVISTVIQNGELQSARGGTVIVGPEGTVTFETDPVELSGAIPPGDASKFAAVQSSNFLIGETTFRGLVTVERGESISNNISNDIILGSEGSLTLVVEEPANFFYSLIVFDDPCITFSRVDFSCISASVLAVNQTLTAAASSSGSALTFSYFGWRTPGQTIRVQARLAGDDTSETVVNTELIERGGNPFSNSAYFDLAPGDYTLSFERNFSDTEPAEVLETDVTLIAGQTHSVSFYHGADGELTNLALSP